MNAEVRPAGATVQLPDPRLGHVFRQALIDFYFNSWRLAPANLAWAGVLIGLLVATAAWLPALLAAPILAVPFAGISRMAARIARGEGASFADFVAGMRSKWRVALTVGAAAAILAIVFGVNIAIGIQLANPIGWFLAATAAYAEIALAMALVAVWPLLMDPQRQHATLRQQLSLAGLVVLARPGRMLFLTLAIAAILIAGVVILAGIALVGVAYTSLVAARYVLPLADRIEGRTPTEPA